MSTTTTAEWRTRLDATTTRRLFLIVMLPMWALFLLTANHGYRDHIDPWTNALTAWNIGTKGSVYLTDHEALTSLDYFGNAGWVVPVRDSAVSQYPPGAAIIAAPIYAVWPQYAVLDTVTGTNRPEAPPIEILLPPLWPGAIAASLSVAMAMGFLAVSFRSVVNGTVAIAGAYLMGLGTSAWSVASHGLWQHGPGMMWIALAGVLASRHLFASGLSFGMAVLTRPLNAMIAGPVGLYMAWKERSVWPAVKIGLGTLVGLVALVIFNGVVFGEVSIMGGYDVIQPSVDATFGGYATNVTDSLRSLDIVAFTRNIALAFVSPSRGLLTWSPFLLVLIPGLPSAWKSASSPVRGAAIGGLLYLIIQYKANAFDGGGGFFGYRYPLEPLTAAAPLLILAYSQWVAKRPRAVLVFGILALSSIMMQTAGVFLL